MKIFRLLTIGIAAAVFAACTSPATNTTNTANSAPPQNTANQAAAESKPGTPAMSPTETLKALSQASAKRDVEAIKGYLSQGTLERLEIGAQEQNKTSDEILKEKDGAPFPKLPELGAEAIDGDNATVEVRNPETREFEKLPFVKEDGRWKVALDIYLDNLDAEMAEEMKKAENKDR